MNKTYDEGEANGEETLFLAINGIPIYFSEDWTTGIGGGLWSTGLAMAKYFQRHAGSVVDNLKCLSKVKYLQQTTIHPSNNQQQNNDIITPDGISAMELGSGNGFLSVCLLALSAHQSIPLKELVVTDMADHLALMAKTLNANPHVWDQLTVIEPCNAKSEVTKSKFDGMLSQTKHSVDKQKQQTSTQQTSTKVIVAEHIWGEFPLNKSSSDDGDIHNKKYDFIFGTDLAYRNSLHEPLIASLLHFSHQHTLCLIGVTMTDTQPAFFDLLTKAFRYEKLADHLLEKEFRGSNFGIIAIQRR